MADFILTATRFDQITERDDQGRPLKMIKHHTGDVVSGLSDLDVTRLLNAGAIAPIGAAAPVPTEHVEQVDAATEAGRPKRTAPVKAWEDYVVALFESSDGKQGLNREDAEKSSKQELIELFGE